jgi:hypothetical protein
MKYVRKSLKIIENHWKLLKIRDITDFDIIVQDNQKLKAIIILLQNEVKFIQETLSFIFNEFFILNW